MSDNGAYHQCNFRGCSEKAVYAVELLLNYPPEVRDKSIILELKGLLVCERCSVHPTRAFLSEDGWRVLKYILADWKVPVPNRLDIRAQFLTRGNAPIIVKSSDDW